MSELNLCKFCHGVKIVDGHPCSVCKGKGFGPLREPDRITLAEHTKRAEKALEAAVRSIWRPYEHVGKKPDRD